MMQLCRRFSKRFTWFVAGLFCTFLFSALSSVTHAGDGNAVDFLESSTFVAPSFEEVAASHLEPNFYE